MREVRVRPSAVALRLVAEKVFGKSDGSSRQTHGWQRQRFGSRVELIEEKDSALSR